MSCNATNFSYFIFNVSRLISADVLALLSDESEYILDTDASDVAMGGVLSIVQDGVECPVAMRANSLTNTKRITV